MKFSIIILLYLPLILCNCSQKTLTWRSSNEFLETKFNIFVFLLWTRVHIISETFLLRKHNYHNETKSETVRFYMLMLSAVVVERVRKTSLSYLPVKLMEVHENNFFLTENLLYLKVLPRHYFPSQRVLGRWEGRSCVVWMTSKDKHICL